MNKRNFLRYTFNRATILKAIALGLVKWLAVLGALYMQWTKLAWLLAIVYGIFCALFLLFNFIRWRKYIGV